jgi:hypothetical protein
MHDKSLSDNNFTKFHDAVADRGPAIPPPLNPDTSEMLDRLRSCYVDLGKRVTGFRLDVEALAARGLLAMAERADLVEHFRDLQGAVNAAAMTVLELDTALGDRGGNGCDEASAVIHRAADHAKYVYAVGARDIAVLQYRVGWLAHTGRMDTPASLNLQRDHCEAMWENLFAGTTCAVRDLRTPDRWWDLYDNTYSDGRQVMVQVRPKNWEELERQLPHRSTIRGTAPTREHPWGSVCHLNIVPNPSWENWYAHEPIEIDLDALIEKIGSSRDGGS